MFESDILFYIAAEVALLLLVICIFLFLHIGNLRKLIRKLEEKVVTLRQTIAEARQETQKALKKLASQSKIKPKNFIDYLDDEIEGTKTHHQSLNPDRDIVLDITPDTPIERQASSLRHAFLIAEKEARYAGDGEVSSWDVLQSKFQQIIQFYESLAPAAEEADEEPDFDEEPEIEEDEFPEPPAVDESLLEEIENYKKRIENLERFKRLFFEMESKWEDAKKQAEEYYEQLMAMGKDLGAGEDFDNVLEQYAKSFGEIESMIVEGAGGEKAAAKASDGDNDTQGERPNVGKMVIANQEEMQRLRNMAVDQHKVITELKKKLYEAQSEEDREQVIADLSEQLEKQQRFLKEAETCTQLIEDELSRAMQENETLRSQLEDSPAGGMDEEEMLRLETLVSDMTRESQEMLGTIAALEAENQQLKEQLEAGGSASGAGNAEAEAEVTMLQDKLTEMQQELLNLQTQHIELEERYLELKMK